jgi:hypothetical protein
VAAPVSRLPRIILSSWDTVIYIWDLNLRDGRFGSGRARRRGASATAVSMPIQLTPSMLEINKSVSTFHFHIGLDAPCRASLRWERRSRPQPSLQRGLIMPGFQKINPKREPPDRENAGVIGELGLPGVVGVADDPYRTLHASPVGSAKFRRSSPVLLGADNGRTHNAKNNQHFLIASASP